MEAVEALALVAGHVDEELLLRNEYLAAENEILLSKLSDLRFPKTRFSWNCGDLSMRFPSRGRPHLRHRRAAPISAGAVE